MLGKLIKYEFRATQRTILPLLAASLVLGVLANFSMRALDRAHSTFIDTLNVIVLMLFVLSVFACLLMAAAVMIQRFRHNLLTDEGYLMFTLPVSVHALLWSKLIVSVVWFAAAGLVCLLSMFTSVMHVDLIGEIGPLLHRLFTELPPGTVATAAEILLLLLLGSICTCLLFYAAMATGFSFARHKWLLSVLCFFALCIIGQIFGVSTMTSWIGSSVSVFADDAMKMVQWTLLITSVTLVVYSALLYLLTWFMLRRRLNLE